MRIQDLQLRRDLVLMAYITGRINRETARAKCRVITRAIERMAAKEECNDGKAQGLPGQRSYSPKSHRPGIPAGGVEEAAGSAEGTGEGQQAWT